MANIQDLFYPPGIKPSEQAANTGTNAYPVSKQQPILISMSDEDKYTLTEAKLRIYSCCKDLGITTEREIKYPDLQRAYKLKFDIELARDEMYNLFHNRNATNALKQGLQSFIHVIEAQKTEDNTIRLKLKENGEEYIKELEDRYDGPPFRQLTPEEVDSIFNPQKREPYNYRRCGGGPRYISRNNRFDRNGIGIGGGSEQQSFYQRQQQQYFPQPQYGPMAAFINEKKQQKDNEKERIRNEKKLLRENFVKMKKDHEAERKRIIAEIQEESEAKMNNLLSCYFEKLGEVETHAIEENKCIIYEFSKLKI
uniref:DUF7516 domain-containing protein n=1 Tax=Panagrolaimus davidi TaxID=227884 RepID=A0A914PVA1_9BILA